MKTRGRIHNIAEKKHEKDFLYAKPANSDFSSFRPYCELCVRFDYINKFA